MRPLGLALLTGLAAATSCDPVHEDAKSALGPEAPDVHPGPTHRPGQPCLVCHDGGFLDPPRFLIGGTVYATPDANAPAVGATVTLVGPDGASTQLTTNSVGNFYAQETDYVPGFPLQVTVESAGGLVVPMQTLVAGNGTVEANGACASCHVAPAGPASPGPVSLTLDDGGTPP
ncbi:MAG TPA: hypothetical protein VHS09_03435 [Polyangiaceae bacterium]|nr:hypothetical protein [Polyangiaceae bacterium]